MITVGLIGCGGMGMMHANCYMAMGDGVKLCAIAEGNTERAKPVAEKAGATLYPSAEELLKNEKPDIIDICLPTFLHAKYAAAAMERGCNVFLEKPACLFPTEADMLLEVYARTGVSVQVGQVVRFMGPYRYLKEAAESGKYGKVISGTFHRLSFRPLWAGGNLCDYRKSGTVALDMHIHDIDYIRYLMGGDPDSFIADAVRDKDGVIEQVFATYRYGDSVITAEGGWDFPDKFPFKAGFRVKFEGATFELDNELRVYPEGGEMFVPEIRKEYEGVADCGINISDMDAFYAELKYFVDCISGGKKPVMAPLEEAIASARIAWREIEMAGGAKK